MIRTLIVGAFLFSCMQDAEKRLSRMMSIFTVAMHVGNTMKGAEAKVGDHSVELFTCTHLHLYFL